MAFCLMLSRFRPRPSSAISMLIWPASWEAETRISPHSGLPAAMRSSGVSTPWSAQLRMQMGQRIAQHLDELAVELGVGAVA